MRHLCLASLVCAGSAAFAAPARANREPTAEVRALVEQAQRHYDLAEYELAIEGFGEAYRRDPRPALLYNLAQAHRLAGDCVRAAQLYRQFLRLAPASRARQLALDHLSSMERCERAARPPDRVAEVEAPPPEPSEVQAELEVDTASPERRGGGWRIGGIATAATGGVALALGSYFARDAQRAADEVSSGYETGAAWADLAELDARGRRSERIGTTLLVTGGLATAAGAVMYYVGRRADRSAVVVPAEGGGRVVVTWGF